jgi:hypothetical protein
MDEVGSLVIAVPISEPAVVHAELAAIDPYEPRASQLGQERRLPMGYFNPRVRPPIWPNQLMTNQPPRVNPLGAKPGRCLDGAYRAEHSVDTRSRMNERKHNHLELYWAMVVGRGLEVEDNYNTVVGNVGEVAREYVPVSIDPEIEEVRSAEFHAELLADSGSGKTETEVRGINALEDKGLRQD